MHYRGPDAEGFYFDEPDHIGLGHRRLSILDLSEAGNQPFYSADGRYVMVYNGEVYNFREIAAKYQVHTKSGSDTEVIIESFARHGIPAVNDFNGMFAIAIWDRQEKKLYLFRDRVGIKPLYYYHADGHFLFASELKALFSVPLVKKEINTDSVWNFLHLGYIPGDSTIYRQVRKIKPGQYAVLSAEGLTIGTYWSVESQLQPRTLNDETTAKKELKGLVESSVAYCMIADVPLGIFLSGGVDSSLVASVAQRLSSQPVNTFSIAFDDKKFNEAPYAQQVADHIGSSHHVFTVTEKQALELADSLLDVYDEPYADSSAIPTMMVSRLARQHVTVALSGDGGDELFMGYGFYYWARRLQNPLLRAFRKPAAAVLAASGKPRLERAAKMFTYPGNANRKSHVFSQEQYYFSQQELASLVIPSGNITVDEHVHYKGRKFSWAEEQSLFDIQNYLPEELLVKTDRASMRYSLEVRVPLLDHRLVEFAINLNESLKLRGNTGKYILKQVLYDYVPASIFARPKWGFAVPLSKWLKTDLRYLVDTWLNPALVAECKLVHPEKTTALVKAWLNGKDYLFTRVWALIILHKWFKEKHA